VLGSQHFDTILCPKKLSPPLEDECGSAFIDGGRGMHIGSPILRNAFRKLAGGLILEITVVIMLKRNKRSKIWPYPHSDVCLLCPLLAGGLIPGFAP